MAEVAQQFIMNLVRVLEKTVSTDQAELIASQSYLEEAAKTNLSEFLVQLCSILADTTKSDVARMAAGLQIKNYLTSKDSSVKQQHQQRWLSLEESARSNIKNLVIQALGTEVTRPSSAAQVIAGIACAEIPLGQWQELISHLVMSVTNNESSAQLREAALETIGYMCSDMDPEHLMGHSNDILTAIVQGMRKDETNDNVKLAATNAMLNTLEFTKENFDHQNERNFIMQVICEATQVEYTKIKVVALQCMVKIMSLYYKYMEAYMGPALFAITVEAMKSTDDDVVLQGIEFWSNVCEEEMDLAIELTEACEAGRPPENISKFYAKGALQYLIPILVELLAKQEELDDEDDWNPSKAAGVCLMLLATLCEDDVLPLVVPFISSKIQDPNWRMRDAAVMAFGSILEGPSTDKVKSIALDGMATFINLLSDESVVVRDTTAWAIGRICELIPEAALKEEYLMPLLSAMVESLNSEPRVAANICWAFSSLAESAYEAAEITDEDPETYSMSGVYDKILAKLLQTTDRSDGHQNNLRNAAYEAIMEMIKNSPKDCYEVVLQTTTVIMQRIQALLLMETHIQSTSDRSHYNDLQSLLCATLQSVLRKVKEEHIENISDNVMSSLIQMLKSSGSGGVQEDALMAVGTLVEVVGTKFLNYMDAFKEYLMAGLQNKAEYQVCIAAVGVVGDICRAVNRPILPYCDEIMGILLTNLSDAGVHRSVKPHILSVFGDIALAIGGDFRNYLPIVLQTLQQAASAQVDKTDYDMVDYLNELRESCLEAFTGIIQGLKGDNEKEISPDVMLVNEHIMFILSFIEVIAKDEDHSEGTVAAASGLIGDLCIAFGPSSGAQLLKLIDSKTSIAELLTEGRRSKTSKTKSLALWGTKEIRKLKSKA
uniref:importin subunit beta-1-like n=1 Tax=Ciona intestinalis TaxID=7719 RepID=UPI00006A5CF3|nr:importin subunit beta-1-like [Ciona intestinalis]|eukprot:XP_009859569.1 importin subunit beta-1-like [Ciona intestinalis]